MLTTNALRRTSVAVVNLGGPNLGGHMDLEGHRFYFKYFYAEKVEITLNTNIFFINWYSYVNQSTLRLGFDTLNNDNYYI